jgi:heme-degrading monooxygenase HmoA
VTTDRKEHAMYAAIRQAQANPGAVPEEVRYVEEGLSTTRTMPGFVAYYLVHAGNDAVLSITLFDTQAQAEAFQAQANDRARERLSPLIQGPLQLSTGEVLLHVAK